MDAPAFASLQGASVHVLEVYGPHVEGAKLFGRPANVPWAPKTLPADEAFDELHDHDSYAYGDHRASASAGPSAAEEALAGAQSALSFWSRGAGARIAALGATAGAGVGQAWLWLRQQTARGLDAVGVGARKSGPVEGEMERAAAPSAWDKAFAWANTDRLADAKQRAETWAEDWARTKGLDLSQMMIIAGAVLLIFGGLLIGGGLLMRASSGPAIAAVAPEEETFSGVTWLFDEPELPLPERAVFTLSGTPEAFLINGLSIRGVNNSDAPLLSLEGVLKPDVQRPDLRLSLQVEKSPDDPNADAADGVTTAALPGNAIPPHTAFRLIFPFPPEAMGDEDGISVEDYFDNYGGLLLRLRYEVDGAEKSVIQYLAPEMLRTQLEEIPAQAGGS